MHVHFEMFILFFLFFFCFKLRKTLFTLSVCEDGFFGVSSEHHIPAGTLESMMIGPQKKKHISDFFYHFFFPPLES